MGPRTATGNNQMRGYPSPCEHARIAARIVLVALVLTAGVSTAVAADRRVLCEQFTDGG